MGAVHGRLHTRTAPWDGVHLSFSGKVSQQAIVSDRRHTKCVDQTADPRQCLILDGQRPCFGDAQGAQSRFWGKTIRVLIAICSAQNCGEGRAAKKFLLGVVWARPWF